MSHDEWWFGEFIVTRLQASNSRIIIQHAQHQKHPNSGQYFYEIQISISLQGFIAEPDRKWTREELPRISEGYTVDDIQSRCIIMNKVSYQ